MKIPIFCILLLLTAKNVLGQTSADSLRLKQLLLEAEIIKAQNAIVSAQNALATEGKKALQAEQDQKLANAKALKELLGENKVESLSGNITISEGKVSTAEVRSLINNLLDSNARKIKDTIEKKSSNIIVYHPAYYNTIPQYFVVKNRLERLSKEFKNFKEGKPNLASVAGIAVGISVVQAIAQLATMFRTETQILVNDEVLDESTIVSKIAGDSPTKSYYYPSKYPIKLIDMKSSTLLTTLGGIEDSKESIKSKLNDIQQRIDTTDTAILKKSQNIVDETKKLLTSRLLRETDTTTIKVKIEKLKLDLGQLEKEKNNLTNGLGKTQKTFEELLEKCDKVTEQLDMITDKENNVSALGVLLRLEKIVEKIEKDSATTLRVAASAKGTNKITKFLWKSTLKSSAAIELQYQLFDKDGKILAADAFMKYDNKTN